MINVDKLDKELRGAGIVISGCNSSGVVWDLENNEIQGLPDVAAVLAAHDPAPEPEPEILVYDKPIKAPDFIVASPKPKKNPKEAFLEAIGEARKGAGVEKSIALIVLDLVEYLDDLEKRVGNIEKK